ncbi:MAG: hypothetical protein AAFX06_30115 [Planctomycetota bacterium]
MNRFATALVFCTHFVLIPFSVEAGLITVLERESSSRNELLAGSGGALQLHNESAATNALTGGFSFSDNGFVDVTTSDFGSTGAASASGSISVSDNVIQTTPDALTLQATRTASGSATYLSGNGLARSEQRQEFRVRFRIEDDPIYYRLTGDFDPGVVGAFTSASAMRLHRPFTTLEFFDITTNTPFVNETGVLPLGPSNSARIYEFRIRLDDVSGASAQNQGPFSDASDFNVQLELSSTPFTSSTVPEPSSMCCAIAFSVFGLMRRKKRASGGR